MKQLDDITGIIVDEAFKIHKGLGPGLLESVYQMVFSRRLQERGLHVEQQRSVSFEYEGIRSDDGLRIDLLVEGRVVVELKSVEEFAPVHGKQVLTYLRLLDLRVGLLINFGAATMKAGLKRIVNNYYRPRSDFPYTGPQVSAALRLCVRPHARLHELRALL